MKREARLLLHKAVNSLILSIEHFNRPWDHGRVDAVLILLDHSFEMFLKAGILHRGGRIRKPREKQTIGFDECVRKALSDAAVQFLTKEQALLLQTINSLRDASQHHLVNLSEQFLYIHAQAGVTLFRDLLKGVFDEELNTRLPERVLPVSTTPPTDLAALFDSEVKEIKRLLEPGRRRHVEAEAKLRAMTIVDGAMMGERLQPAPGQLRKLADLVRQGASWDQIFPGVASINLKATGTGPSLDLRITKKVGLPITLVPEGTPGASVVAVKRVNDLDFYTLGLRQLAAKVEITPPRATALIRHLKIQEDAECFKRITIGSSVFNRYSPKAIDQMQQGLKRVAMEEVWAGYKQGLHAREAS